MKGVTPEMVTGVRDHRPPPLPRQAGGPGRHPTGPPRVTGGEIIRAMTRLGFTCHARPDAAPVRVPAPLQTVPTLPGAAALDV